MSDARILQDGRIERRIPTRVHTRKLDRSVAHKNMERVGLKKVNKPNCAIYKGPFGSTVKEDYGSYFANHWRETANVPTIDLRGRKIK